MRRAQVRVPELRRGLSYQASNARTGEILQHPELAPLLRAIAASFDVTTSEDVWTIVPVKHVCDSAIFSGPGHQSIGYCIVMGYHGEHQDRRGHRWLDKHIVKDYTDSRGRSWRCAFTGFFDESPDD